jgi:UDPglucose 6-dehydrogenase
MKSSNSKPKDIQNILCIGSGYVGALTMTVFANYCRDKHIVVYDKFKDLIDRWNFGGKKLKQSQQLGTINDNNHHLLPIVEKDFEIYFSKSFDYNLSFSSCITDEHLLKTDLIFVCVNTPSLIPEKIRTDVSIEEVEDEISKGIQHNLKYVNKCIEEICERILKSENVNILLKERIIVQKSTVPIETLKNIQENLITYFKLNKLIVQEIIKKSQSENNKLSFESDEEIKSYVSKYFKLVNIPEFLAEGQAIQNLIKPDRVIIGYLIGDNESYEAAQILKKIYETWIDSDKIIQIDSKSSEMTKIVSNAFLAQRISSINSLTELCEIYGADVNKISETVGRDSRIGRTYLKASMGFGGSCLKKDTLSLIYILSSKNLTVQAKYWTQVLLMNEYQRLRISEKIKNASLQNNGVVTIFGVSFKGDINDVRSSNGIFLISYLLNHKIKINIYDPYASKRDVENELRLYSNEQSEWTNINYFFDSYLDSLSDSSVLVFCTNHTIFNSFDLKTLAMRMNENSCIFDLYDLFSTESLRESGFNVFKLGVNDLKEY